MEEVSLEKCKWCNGTGNGASHIMDTSYPCPDCEGTGYKEGKRAERYFDYLMEEKEKELVEKGLL
jgi:DnaJ-class molecular chaperone